MREISFQVKLVKIFRHLGGFLLFSPTNKLQHLYKYTCNFSYDLSQNVPVPTCQIYTFLNRF